MQDTAQTNASRAVAVYDAMQTHCLVRDGTSLYRLTSPWTGGNRYAYVWEFSRALIGTLALAGVPPHLVGGTPYAHAVEQGFGALERYWNPGAKPPAYDSYLVGEGGGDRYHDDNAWLALAFIQRYRMGLSTSLERAQQLYAFARAGWDSNAGDPHPGGIFWVEQSAGYGLTNHDRGTGATAGSAELGYHLSLLTGDTAYIGDGVVSALPTSLGASTMANWVADRVDSSVNGSGPYWNLVRSDGSLDTNLWSYNQGVVLGANVLRYQVSRDTAYLSRAAAIASQTLSTYGDFLGHPPPFNAMLFQNLLMLYPFAGASLQASIMDRMLAYADRTWTDPAARDPATNLFYFDDAGHPARGTGQPAQLRDQGAMVQLYALLAWQSTDYANLT